MNLYISTYLLAAILLFFAGSLALNKKGVFAFLRSKIAAVITFGGAGLWFLYSLSQLGEADFGNIKFYLIAMFGIAGILAFYYLDDFLSVRGLAVLGLMLSAEFLESAFMQEPMSRLILVTLTYVMVVCSLYFGALPYRLRDMLEWLYEKTIRLSIFNMILVLCSASLILATIWY